MIICNLIVSLLLLSLSVSGFFNETEPRCVPVLKVPRNTVFKARVMTELKINCTVNLQGCWRFPIISWCRLFGDKCEAFNHSDYIKTEWKSIKELEGMSFLIFKNISMEDTGLYRCKEADTSVSHTINVTVTVDNEDEVSHNQSKEHDPNPNHDALMWLWPHVYICSGIAGLVIIIITVTLLTIRHKATKSTREEITTKTQYMETQSKDLLPPPIPHHNTRSSSHQTTSSYRGSETPPVRGSSSAGKVSERSRNTVSTDRSEEENALVYASLNHQTMPRVPRRAARQEPEPEPSEYAAIRFR